jgi:hypothetical protein
MNIWKSNDRASIKLTYITYSSTEYVPFSGTDHAFALDGQSVRFVRIVIHSFIGTCTGIVSTNTIEGEWGRLKTWIRAKHGIREELVPEFIREYEWRRDTMRKL